MKISQEEISAARSAYALYMGSCCEPAVRDALIAAYKVRSTRKAAKRERQRKERDKQVQDNRAPLTILPIEPDETFSGVTG